jgi:acetylornithine/succinyldiaminopimelate/putrescine aminotransferase
MMLYWFWTFIRDTEEAESFFAHQHHVKADIICLAKGMGNGFPIGGIFSKIHSELWIIGNHFCGNHLVCAGIAVLMWLKAKINE